jgi:hypothetical protein
MTSIPAPPFNAPLTEPDGKLGKMRQPWHMWLGIMFPFWQRSQNVGVYDYQTPTTGFSYSALDYTEELLLNPAGVLATGSVVLPPNPTDGLVFTIVSTQTITSFTVTASHPIVGPAVTTLAPSVPVSWRYRSANTTWYRTQ